MMMITDLSADNSSLHPSHVPLWLEHKVHPAQSYKRAQTGLSEHNTSIIANSQAAIPWSFNQTPMCPLFPTWYVLSHTYINTHIHTVGTVVGSNSGRGKRLVSSPKGPDRTVHPFYSGWTGVLSRGLNGLGMNLATHLHLVLRSSMSGAIPLLPIYALMVSTGTFIHIYIFIHSFIQQSVLRQVQSLFQSELST